MLKVLKSLISSSRLWLSAGVLSMFASILLGYHQNQLDAESALAQKITLPDAVVVQEFSSTANENEFGEVHVLAEVALDRAVRVDIGNESAPRLVDVVPMYPVSRQSFPVARSLTQLKRRPAPRSDVAAVAEHSKALQRIESVPVGIVVFGADSESRPSDLLRMEKAQGLNGPLVDLMGKRLEDAIVLDLATDLLAQKGVALIQGPLLVSPYLQGRTESVGPDFEYLQRALFWASLLMISVGLASLSSLVPLLKKSKAKEPRNQVRTVGPSSVVDLFQPIAGPDEIGDECDEAKGGRVSRVLTIATHAFRTKSRP